MVRLRSVVRAVPTIPAFRPPVGSVAIRAMDTLTHALLGAALGQAAFGRRLGWRATVVGVVGAELPDMDFFIRSASDPLLNVELHRHFTHSFVFSPVVAFVAALPWCFRAEFKAQRLALFLCGLVACWSHILLDACTSYGTQFLVPFSQHRFGWDFISIVDPLFTGALAVGLAGKAICDFRRGPSESAPGGGASLVARRWLWFALGFCAAYLALGAGQRARAHAVQSALAASRGHRAERSEVMPTLANQIVWRSLYLHEGQIYSDRVRVPWFGAASVREGNSLPLLTRRDLSAAEAAREGSLRSFDRFAWFSEGWIARSPADPAVIGDMRYSLTANAFDPIWGIRFTSPEAPTEVVWVNRTRDRRIPLGELWAEITGASPEYRPLGANPK